MKPALLVLPGLALGALALAIVMAPSRPERPLRPEPKLIEFQEVIAPTPASPPPAVPVAHDAVSLAVSAAPSDMAIRVVSAEQGTKAFLAAALGSLSFAPMLNMAATIADSPESRRLMLDEVARRLGTARGEERCRLLALQAALGDVAGLASWKAALAADPNPETRALLARNAPTDGLAGAEVAEALLDRATNDRDASVRAAAIEGMPGGLSEGRIDLFLAALARETDPEARRAMLVYLSEDAPSNAQFLAECGRLAQDAASDKRVRALAKAAAGRAAETGQ